MVNAENFSEEELPIYEALAEIREHLIILKRDKSTYIKSADVLRLYEQFGAQAALMARLSRGQDNAADSRTKLLETRDDVFLLISLFFMTIGRNNEAPAVYAASVGMRRLLSHLFESGNFTFKDLSGLCDKLKDMFNIVRGGSGSHRPEILEILKQSLADAEGAVEELKARLAATLDPSLYVLHEQLVGLRRQIAGIGSKKNHTKSELQDLQEQLKNIESSRVSGQFVNEDGQSPELGQVLMTNLLEQCLALAEEIETSSISISLEGTFNNLSDIKSHLDKLQITQSWALRETDLYGFLKRLQLIDEGRRNGKFVDQSGAPVEGQTIMLYMLRRCFALIYILMISSEPVSEALQPIHNQLTTVRRCLLEVKASGGIASARELYPYSMKLASIDNMRVDGKFMVGNEIPEGQASVTTLMEDCFDLVHELRVEMEGKATHDPIGSGSEAG